jgi:hypothetical protein
MGGDEPRAAFKMPITVEDVLNSRMIVRHSDTTTGIRFLPTEPFGRRSGNGRMGGIKSSSRRQG